MNLAGKWETFQYTFSVRLLVPNFLTNSFFTVDDIFKNCSRIVLSFYKYKITFTFSSLPDREHEILREEIKSLQEVRSRLQQRVQELEDELKKVKEEAEAAKTTKYDKSFSLKLHWIAAPFSVPFF